jgi:hypothetical protein
MRTDRSSTLLLVGLALCIADLPSAVAQDLFIYPSQGQSQGQQDQDRNECHAWAVRESGFDPVSPPPPPAGTPAPQGSVGGGVVKGGAVGAAGGAVVGAIAGDAGKGAAIGAIGGGLFGGVRSNRRQAAHAEQQAAAQQQYQAQVAQLNQTYNRALAACLQGRGYTVN